MHNVGDGNAAGQSGEWDRSSRTLLSPVLLLHLGRLELGVASEQQPTGELPTNLQMFLQNPFSIQLCFHWIMKIWPKLELNYIFPPRKQAPEVAEQRQRGRKCTEAQKSCRWKHPATSTSGLYLSAKLH